MYGQFENFSKQGTAYSKGDCFASSCHHCRWLLQYICSFIFQKEKEEYSRVMTVSSIVSTKNQIVRNTSKNFEIALKDHPLVFSNFHWRGRVFCSYIPWYIQEKQNRVPCILRYFHQHYNLKLRFFTWNIRISSSSQCRRIIFLKLLEGIFPLEMCLRKNENSLIL